MTKRNIFGLYEKEKRKKHYSFHKQEYMKNIIPFISRNREADDFPSTKPTR